MKKSISWVALSVLFFFFSSGTLFAADVSISAQTELAEAPAENDILPLYDVTATAGKRITVINLMKVLESAMTGFEIHNDNLAANLKAVAGLTFADASVIQLTGVAAAAVLTSGGNNYFLASTSDNSALEFKTPAATLTAIGGQAAHASLTSIAGLTETNGGIPYGTADNAYAWLAAGTANYLLQGNGAGAPTWTNAPTVSAANLTSFPTLNQNTSGTAANVSGTPALPNGTTATTQAKSDSSTKLATTAFVLTQTNTEAAAGIVATGAGQVSKVWKTDSDGIPGWRDDATGGTPTFDTIGAGTASSKAFKIGTLSTLGYESTGTIDASHYKGVTTVTAAQFGYLDAQSSIQTQMDLKAPKAGPTFTGTVTLPAAPFTVGATAVTTTGAQFNYLNAATGTTGTTTGKIVFDTSPTFTGTLTVPVGLTGVLRADTGVVSVDSDVTDIVAAGTSSAAGKLQLATTAEAVTGTDTAKAVTAAGLTSRLAVPGAIGGTTPSTVAATSFNKMAITAPATSSTLAVADGKTLTVSNTITLTATDSSTLAIGTGGTLGTAAYTAATAYQPVDADLTALAGLTMAQGDLIYGTGAATVAKLAKDANATRYLSNQGAGATNNPSWSLVNVTNGITGVVPVANMGTGTPDGTKFLRDDGTWVVPGGAGDVTSVGYDIAGGTACVDGACLDGTSDGGSKISLYSASGSTVIRNNAGVVEIRNATDAAYANIKVASLSTSAVDGSNLIKIENNTAIAPTAASMEIYPEANVWKINQNGTEYSIPLSASANQLTFGAMTSGGIPYASASNTIASSAALTQYGVLYGGGAGGSPAATAAGAANTVLHGGATVPSYSAVVSADISGQVAASKGGTGIANNDLNTITFAGGNFGLTVTLDQTKNVTFPTGATATLARTDAGNTFTGTQALGTNNLTMTGSLAATGARVTKGWFTDIESTNAPSVNGVAANATNGLIINPMTAAGDLLTAGASGVSTGKIAAVAAGQVLVSAGTTTAPVWSGSPTLSGDVIISGGDLTLGAVTPVKGTITFYGATSGTAVLSATDVAGSAVAVRIPAAAGTIAVATPSATATQALFATTTSGAPAYRAIAAADLPSVNIGTTAVDLTRASAALTLAGLTLTTPDIGAASGTSLALTGAITGTTAITMGSATVDTGVFTMIKGAQTSDPQATLTLSADGVGGLTIATLNGSNGDITLTPSGGDTIITTDLTVTGADITLLSATAGAKITGGDRTVTLAGTSANAESLVFTMGSNDNIVTVSSGTSATQLGFSALNLVTTGTIQGGIVINSDANGMSAAEMTAVGMYGSLFIATGAGTWILPTAAAGMSACLMSSGAAADLILDTTAGDTLRLKGTEGGDGKGATNAAAKAAGDFICVVATAANKWSSMGMGGAWVIQP